MDWLDAVIPHAFFLTVILVAILVFAASRARLKAQREFQQQLLQALGTGPELLRALECGEAARLAEAAWARGGPRHRVLSKVAWGIVLTTSGLGCMAAGRLDEDFPALGVMLAGIGVGMLLAAWLTNFLAERWGLSAHAEGRAGSS